MLRSGCVERCPACSHRELSRAESLSLKKEYLTRVLAPWKGVLADVQSLEGESRWAYRDKVCLRAVWSEDRSHWEFGVLRASPAVRPSGDADGGLGGHPRGDVGSHASGGPGSDVGGHSSGDLSGHPRGGLGRSPSYGEKSRGEKVPREKEFVAIPECPVHSEGVRRAIRFFSGTLPGPTELPLVFLVITGPIATLVVKSKARQLAWDPHASELEKAGLRGILINFNPSAGERVFSSKGWSRLWGEEVCSIQLRGRDHRFGPASFQQVLPTLHAHALDEAEVFLDPCRFDAVIDLYSGSGVSLRRWIDRQAKVVAVELGGEAVRLGRLNVPEALYYQGRCSERIPQVNAWIQERSADSGRLLAFVNPPRTGLEAEVVEWLRSEVRPARIAYLSCNAVTAARDLAKLVEAGYAVRKVSPYDFFPQTRHIEILCLLDSGDSSHRLSGPWIPARLDR